MDGCQKLPKMCPRLFGVARPRTSSHNNLEKHFFFYRSMPIITYQSLADVEKGEKMAVRGDPLWLVNKKKTEMSDLEEEKKKESVLQERRNVSGRIKGLHQWL